MEYNPDVKVEDTCGRNVLHMAVRAGQLKILGLILNDSAFEELHEKRTVGGVTPLMAAAQGGNIYAVGECLNNGMNPFAYDRLGKTAYEYSQPF